MSFTALVFDLLLLFVQRVSKKCKLLNTFSIFVEFLIFIQQKMPQLSFPLACLLLLAEQESAKAAGKLAAL